MIIIRAVISECGLKVIESYYAEYFVPFCQSMRIQRMNHRQSIGKSYVLILYRVRRREKTPSEREEIPWGYCTLLFAKMYLLIELSSCHLG